MTAKIILQLAALLGALSVGIGAFAAHGLRKSLEAAGRFETFETAVRYQFFHTLALLGIGVPTWRVMLIVTGFPAMVYITNGQLVSVVDGLGVNIRG